MFSGKSTIARLLQERLGYAVISARQILRELADDALDARVDLQRVGAEIEERTQGQWLADAAAAIAAATSPRPVVVDSARTKAQVQAVRKSLGHVHHLHLTAPDAVLRRRFKSRASDLIEPASLQEAASHPVEQETSRLGQDADLILDSGESSPEALLEMLISRFSDSGTTS
jgi:adenylosuccinate synthase